MKRKLRQGLGLMMMALGLLIFLIAFAFSGFSTTSFGGLIGLFISLAATGMVGHSQDPRGLVAYTIPCAVPVGLFIGHLVG